MKSIKEKADYLYQGYGTNPNRKALRENFIQGANYVLEHLSMTITVSEDSYLRENLKIMIEQLKK